MEETKLTNLICIIIGIGIICLGIGIFLWIELVDFYPKLGASVVMVIAGFFLIYLGCISSET
jgi:CHASE2 domain-containing sensor protein